MITVIIPIVHSFDMVRTRLFVVPADLARCLRRRVKYLMIYVLYMNIYIYNNTMIIYIYISIPFGMIIPHGRAKHVRLEFFSPHS